MANRRDAVRDYYNAALDESNRSGQDFTWSGSSPLYRDNNSTLFRAGFATTALLAAGNIRVGKGRVWDKYVSGLRHFEEYFLGRIPRTLQLSNIASQFETAARVSRTITADQISKMPKGQIAYLEKLTGVDAYDLFREGLSFKDGKLSLATSGKTVLENAGIIRNINKSHHFSSSYARSLGVNVNAHEFSQAIAYTNAAGKEASEIFQFIGGKNRLQHVGRQLSGYGTELVERVNRLAKAPFDFPLVGPALKKVFGKHTLGVESGPGLRTFARLTGKLGLLGGAAVIGYKTADWAVRRAGVFNNTIFDQGITAGAATIWAKTNLGYAKFGDVTGWTESAKKQEEYAPGSTSLLKLSAFPAIGAFGVAAEHYLERIFLTRRLQNSGHDVAVASNLAEKVLKRFKKAGITSSLGKTFRESGSSILRSLAHSPLTVKTTLGALTGAAFTLPYLFNALAPSRSEEELHDLYTGKSEVAVHKGRFWELGRTPYEGTSIDYFRPHWYARMMQRGKEHAVWGGLEGDKEFSPVEKFYRSNFTYDLEREHYYDRPYPVSGRAFYDVPIIGPILSATLGRIVKPPVSMHQDEFYNEGTGEYLQTPPGFGVDRNTGLGEKLPGAPISPHGIKGTIGEQFYRLTELSGLPGFLFNTVKQQLTGSQDLFDQDTQLASADQIDSASRDYWDLSLGGVGGTSELFRRLLPHKRNQIDTYNPIRNTMPDWLPGAGERGPDLLHGDPYARIAEGEIRLPGEGYASRFSELKGVNPEDYPLIHKYKILADVAPYTDQFGDVEQEAAIAFKEGRFSKEEEELYHQTQGQLKEKRNKKTFYEYKYRDQKLNPVQQALSDWNEKQKDPASGPSWYQKIIGSMWETETHDAETPLELISPLAPGAKLLHMHTALEDYKQTQVYGTESAFWDRPWSNFIRPAIESTEAYVRDKFIPGHIQERRRLEEYFDILKYLKFTRLKDMAVSADDKEAIGEFEQKRRETLFGVNPYTFNYTQIFRGLPRRDRDYFNEFVETKDIDERKEILNLVPENEKGLFMAKWKQSDATDFAKAVKLGLLNRDEVSKGEEQIKQMYNDMETEGLPKSQELWQEYIKTRNKGESYPDWYRRAKLLPQKASELGFNIPGPDWVGFNPAVDLNDVKLKVVQNLGESIQDYDLWPQQEKALLYKQSYINDQAVAPVQQPNKSSESEIRKIVQDVLTEFKIDDVQINVSMIRGNNNHVNMDIQEDRTAELKERLRAS